MPTEPLLPLFVYGTLKQGFLNHGVNQGRRVAGEFVTVERYPLFLIGPRCLPWLANLPGQGEPIVGQLFEVDAAALARMDVLERVTEPDWYTRVTIQVRPRHDAGASPIACQIYFGSASRLHSETIHSGPHAEYLPEHEQLYLRNLP